MQHIRVAPQSSLSVGIVVGSMSHKAGGLYQSVRRTAQELVRRGVIVTVYALEDSESAGCLAAWYPLRPRLFRTIGPKRLGLAPHLTKALMAANHDIVHQHGLWQAFSASVLSWRKKTGRPVIVSPRGMLSPWALRRSSWKKGMAATTFERANLNGARLIHALTQAEQDDIQAWAPGAEVVVIPNGVDPAPKLLPVGHVINKPKTLLFLGRLDPKKGLSELIHAWAQVGQQRPNWRLVIAGWGEIAFERSLRQQAAWLGIGDRIAFSGPLYGARKAHALAAADAFVLPSHSEGQPMAVLEAWAAGRPVLMTEACNLPEGFSEGAALKIDARPGRLAPQLVDALGRADLPDFGLRGRKLVAERFSWDVTAAAHVNAYRSIAGRVTKAQPALAGR